MCNSLFVSKDKLFWHGITNNEDCLRKFSTIWSLIYKNKGTQTGGFGQTIAFFLTIIGLWEESSDESLCTENTQLFVPENHMY